MVHTLFSRKTGNASICSLQLPHVYIREFSQHRQLGRQSETGIPEEGGKEKTRNKHYALKQILKKSLIFSGPRFPLPQWGGIKEMNVIFHCQLLCGQMKSLLSLSLSSPSSSALSSAWNLGLLTPNTVQTEGTGRDSRLHHRVFSFPLFQGSSSTSILLTFGPDNTLFSGLSCAL